MMFKSIKRLFQGELNLIHFRIEQLTEHVTRRRVKVVFLLGIVFLSLYSIDLFLQQQFIAGSWCMCGGVALGFIEDKIIK